MSKEAKLGLFVVAVIAVFMFFTINMGTLFLKKGEKTHKLYFSSIGTVEIGAPVKQAGLDVGVVEKMYRQTIAEPTKTTYIVVDIRVSNEAQIAIDSKASIQTMGMMGEKYIEVTYGNSPISATAETHLEGQGPADVDKVMEKMISLSNDIQFTVQSLNKILGDSAFQKSITNLIANLDQFSKNLNDLIGGQKSQFTTIVNNIEAASADLRSMMATAEVMIGNASSLIGDNQSDIRKTVANTAEITGFIKKDLMGNINTTTTSIRDFVKDLHDFSEKLNNAAENAGTMIAKLNTVVDESRPDVKEAMHNLKKFTDSANNATAKIDDLLKQVEQRDGIVHKIIFDEELANNAKKTIQQAEGALTSFNKFPERLSLITQFRYFNDRPRFDLDDNYFRADMGVQYNFNDKFYAMIGANDLGADNGIEAQVYYQLGKFILHGGVIESEMGLGIDWQIIDRWMVGIEAIGLTDREKDRVDVYTDIKMWKDIFLTGGVQDIGNERYPNVGLKLKF